MKRLIILACLCCGLLIFQARAQSEFFSELRAWQLIGALMTIVLISFVRFPITKYVTVQNPGSDVSPWSSITSHMHKKKVTITLYGGEVHEGILVAKSESMGSLGVEMQDQFGKKLVDYVLMDDVESIASEVENGCARNDFPKPT